MQLLKLSSGIVKIPDMTSTNAFGINFTLKIPDNYAISYERISIDTVSINKEKNISAAAIPRNQGNKESGTQGEYKMISIPLVEAKGQKYSQVVSHFIRFHLGFKPDPDNNQVVLRLYGLGLSKDDVGAWKAPKNFNSFEFSESNPPGGKRVPIDPDPIWPEANIPEKNEKLDIQNVIDEEFKSVPN